MFIIKIFLLGMLFLWKNQKEVSWSKLNLRDEFRYNYTILCEISKKDIASVFWAVASVHTYEYSQYLWICLKSENINIAKELLNNLNIDDEIIETYRILNSHLENIEQNEWLKETILSIILIHSKNYVNALQNYAKNNKNFLLAKKISEIQAKEGCLKKEEIKSKIINQYKKLADTLYWWSFQWSVYSRERDICLLLGKIIILFWDDDELAILCDNITKDISERWQNMLEQIAHAIENDKKWWFFDENNLLHLNI